MDWAAHLRERREVQVSHRQPPCPWMSPHYRPHHIPTPLCPCMSLHHHVPACPYTTIPTSQSASDSATASQGSHPGLLGWRFLTQEGNGGTRSQLGHSSGPIHQVTAQPHAPPDAVPGGLMGPSSILSFGRRASLGPSARTGSVCT